jgi:hypothetical protein
MLSAIVCRIHTFVSPHFGAHSRPNPAWLSLTINIQTRCGLTWSLRGCKSLIILGSDGSVTGIQMASFVPGACAARTPSHAAVKSTYHLALLCRRPKYCGFSNSGKNHRNAAISTRTAPTIAIVLNARMVPPNIEAQARRAAEQGKTGRLNPASPGALGWAPLDSYLTFHVPDELTVLYQRPRLMHNKEAQPAKPVDDPHSY